MHLFLNFITWSLKEKADKEENQKREKKRLSIEGSDIREIDQHNVFEIYPFCYVYL